ncbi:MAG: TRAP transporter small permease subunit [Clostridiales Family XIII bacterium]|jgi:TRAP-type C4-dicarboxylate transport system permease small subunit|nr:TRAP transporter small permease subunit [Clostridiales Family XIII bacterium]
MKYPKFMTLINQVLGCVSGSLIVAIGFLAVFEALARGAFSSPTSWTLDISSYFLIWAVFLGSAYAYQEKGHVAVDILRDLVGKRLGKPPRRAMAFAGYIIVLLVIIVLFRAGVIITLNAARLDQLTIANFQIPIAALYIAIVIGSVNMATTVVFIMLDIASGGEKYL